MRTELLKEQSFYMLLKVSWYKFKLECDNFRMLNIISMVTTKKRAKEYTQGTLLAVQWLRRHASTAKGCGFNPWSGTKIPHTTWHAPPHKKMGDIPFRWSGQKVGTVVLAWSLWSGEVTEHRDQRDLLRVRELFCILIAVMVTQPCTVTKSHHTIYLELVNFIIYEWYLHK